VHAEIIRFASKTTMFPKHEVFQVVVMKTRKLNGKSRPEIITFPNIYDIGMLYCDQNNLQVSHCIRFPKRFKKFIKLNCHLTI
jgi:hypothetical protein